MKLTLSTMMAIAIVFFIYLGMAYVTKMPVNNEIVESNDDMSITYIKPIENKPTAKLNRESNKASLNIKPNKTDYSNVLKTPKYSEMNDDEKLGRQDLKNLLADAPVIKGQDFTPLMDKSDLESMLSKPMYPYEAYKNKVNGYVLLKLYISKVGKVTNVDVLDSSPKGVFESTAIKAAYKKEFPIDKRIVDPKAFTKNILTKYDAGS